MGLKPMSVYASERASTLRVQSKEHDENLRFLDPVYDMVFFKFCFRRCLKGSVFLLFNQFLEIVMTWSQPIIVRECIFKSHNLCFALR